MAASASCIIYSHKNVQRQEKREKEKKNLNRLEDVIFQEAPGKFILKSYWQELYHMPIPRLTTCKEIGSALISLDYSWFIFWCWVPFFSNKIRLLGNKEARKVEGWAISHICHPGHTTLALGHSVCNGVTVMPNS